MSAEEAPSANNPNFNLTVEGLTGADEETKQALAILAERDAVQANRVEGVQTVLVVLSSKAMAFDVDSLKHLISSAYPDAAIFFRTTAGKPLRGATWKRVDLLIDFTGPGQRQPFLLARKLRRMAKVAVGRNAGLFRKRIFDRIFDEKGEASSLPVDSFERERLVQRKVLGLAGVPCLRAGEGTLDLGKSIALDLPPLQGE